MPWWFWVVLVAAILGCLSLAFAIHYLDQLRYGIPTRRQRRAWKRERS